MSADNIMLVIQEDGEWLVYEVGYSELSEIPGWHEPRGRARVRSFLKHHVPYWRGASRAGAEAYCLQTMEEYCVEYDYAVLGD